MINRSCVFFLAAWSVACQSGRASVSQAIPDASADSGVDAGYSASDSGSVWDGGGSPDAGACASTDSERTFTADIVDRTLIKYIDPPGRAVGGDIKPHAYLYMKSSAADAGMPVFAPAASKLTGMAYYEQAGVDQYFLYIKVACDLHVVLDHLSSVSARLLAVRPPRGTTTVATPINPPLQLSAGEQLGLLGERGIMFTSLDFRVYDARVLNGCEGYAHYAQTLQWNPGESYVNAVCGFDYFTAPLAAGYRALLGYEGVLYPQATCYSACRNVLGKIAGKWFLDSGTDSTYGSVVGIARELDGTTITATSLSQFSAPSGPDPATTSADTCYCDASVYICFRNVTNTNASIIIGSGECPTTVPDGGKVYAR